MRTGPENYRQGESLQETETESKSEIQKIQDEVKRIQGMINDMEAKASIHTTRKEGDALNSVIEREKTTLAQKRSELSRLILQAEKEADEKYLIPEEKPVQEFWTDDAFDNAMRATGEYQEADRLDAARKKKLL